MAPRPLQHRWRTDHCDLSFSARNFDCHSWRTAALLEQGCTLRLWESMRHLSMAYASETRSWGLDGQAIDTGSTIARLMLRACFQGQSTSNLPDTSQHRPPRTMKMF